MMSRKLRIVVICAGFFCSPLSVFPADEDITKDIQRYETFLRRNPRDTRARHQLAVLYHNRAVQYSQQQKWEPAFDDIEQALALAPQEKIILSSAAVIHNNYGLILKEQGNYLLALEHVEQALAYQPDNPQVRENTGAVYFDLAREKYEKGEYDACRRYVRQAREFAPDNPYVYALSGELAYLLDDYVQAEQDWSKALALNPSDTQVSGRLDKLRKDKQAERGFSVRDLGKFKLKFEGREPLELANAVSDILLQAYQDVGQDLDLFPNTLVPVIIYPAQGERPDYVPDWAAATYDGKIRLPMEQGSDSLMLKAVLYHEYTHALIFQLAGVQVPLWLNEGLAEYEARRFFHVSQRQARRRALLKARRENTLFKINSELATADRTFFDELPRDRIELAYAQAESFVTFLISRHSLYNLRKVLARLAEGDSPRKAIEDVLYTNLDSLEQDWLETLTHGSEEH